MAGIDEYRTSTGEIRLGVRWRQRRYGAVVLQSVTFENRQEAIRFARMLVIFIGDADKACKAIHRAAVTTNPVTRVGG